MKDEKETLYSLLESDDEDKISDFLIRNGKKKSYCPVCFRKDKKVEYVDPGITIQQN